LIVIVADEAPLGDESDNPSSVMTYVPGPHDMSVSGKYSITPPPIVALRGVVDVSAAWVTLAVLSIIGWSGKPDGVCEALRERVCVCDRDWLRVSVPDRLIVPLCVFVPLDECVPDRVGVIESVWVVDGEPVALGDSDWLGDDDNDGVCVIVRDTDAVDDSEGERVGDGEVVGDGEPVVLGELDSDGDTDLVVDCDGVNDGDCEADDVVLRDWLWDAVIDADCDGVLACKRLALCDGVAVCDALCVRVVVGELLDELVVDSLGLCVTLGDCVMLGDDVTVRDWD